MPNTISKCCMCGLTSAMRRSRMRALACPTTEEELTAVLQKHGVDVELFGKGKAKPVSALLRELKEGSCRLEVDRTTGQLLRSVEPVFVELMYEGHVLVERAHILPNGNRRERNALLAEKVEPSDPGPLAASLRGIREELGVVLHEGLDGLKQIISDDDTFIEKMDSVSYPGIAAVYTTHRVRLEIRAGSTAEDVFKSCGVPQLLPFETDEEKPEGGTQHFFWEWMPLEEAMTSRVKGLAVVTPSPIAVVPTVSGKPGGA